MPKPRLSRERIVTTAISIADERGVEAVTLRSIAKNLAVHVTSLYNHIPTKEAVLDEMVRSLVAEAGLPVGSFTWQEWVRRFAVSIRTLANRHPGAFQLFLRGPARGVQAMESFESAIVAFRSDGFNAVSTFCAIKAVNVAVVGLVLDDLAGQMNPAVEMEIDQVSKDSIPAFLEIQAAGRRADSFTFVLDALIVGIAASRNEGESKAGKLGT